MGGEDGFGVRRRSVENEKERNMGVLMALCMSSLICGDESGPDWVAEFEEYRNLNGPTSVIAQCGARRVNVRAIVVLAVLGTLESSLPTKARVENKG